MGQYKVILPFTRNGGRFEYGDLVDLPDKEPQELRDVGMLLEYGIIGIPDKNTDTEKK